MQGRMKRSHFDPVFERRKVLRQSDAIRCLRDALNSLTSSVETVLNNMADLSGCNQLIKDLVLVVSLGGMKGANKLSIATATFPEQFSHRNGYIKEIVNEGVTKELNTAQIDYLVTLLDSKCQEDSMPALRRVSEATAVVHTAFLAPPVSECVTRMQGIGPLQATCTNSGNHFYPEWTTSCTKMWPALQQMWYGLQLQHVYSMYGKRSKTGRSITTSNESMWK